MTETHSPGDLRRRAAWTPEKANGSRPVTQSGGGVHGPFCTSPKANRQSIPRVHKIKWKRQILAMTGEDVERINVSLHLFSIGADVEFGESEWTVSWPKEAQR